MNDYETVVDNFIAEYSRHLPTWWSGQNYFRAQSSPEVIRFITEALSKHFTPLFENPYISGWRQIEEWPESMDNLIVYSIVNLLTHQNDNFLPHDIKRFILEQPIPEDDPNYRYNILYAIYGTVYDNMPELDRVISSNKQDVSTILGPDSLSLYGTTEHIYLFSGVKDVVFSNAQLFNFIKQSGTPNQDFPLRSWTVDLRVAMQFTSSDDVTSRHYPRLSDKPFRVILITKQQEICYVSPYEESWEAEVLVPASQYICGGYFFKDLGFFNPPYDRAKEPKQFLFVIIEKINPQPKRVMNQQQFNRFIRGIHDRFLKDRKRILYGIEDDEYDVAEGYPRKKVRSFKATLKKRKKGRKKKRGKPKTTNKTKI